jgi:hypothetical protein
VRVLRGMIMGTVVQGAERAAVGRLTSLVIATSVHADNVPAEATPKQALGPRLWDEPELSGPADAVEAHRLMAYILHEAAAALHIRCSLQLLASQARATQTTPPWM